MKQTYRVLAYLTAAAVAFQTATIAYGLFALGAWVSDGHGLDKARLEGGGFGGSGSFDLHGSSGPSASGTPPRRRSRRPSPDVPVVGRSARRR